MAVIGTFNKDADGVYRGSISTLVLKLSEVRLVPEEHRHASNSPSHRVLIDEVMVGAAWPKQNDTGRDYLNIKIDCPTLPAAFFATLSHVGEQEYELNWNRPNYKRASG